MINRGLLLDFRFSICLFACLLAILFFITGKHMQTVPAFLSYKFSFGCV